jgi:dipeptidyl aminopeptidase/acylaminoacyl peptidase
MPFTPGLRKTRFARRNLLFLLLAAFALPLLLPSPAGAVDRADMERALGLRARYEILISNIVEDVQWIDGRLFVYRNQVKGGYEFVIVDAEKGGKRPAFDHARMAAAYTKATGIPCTALTLPFQRFRFVEGGAALEIRGGGPFGIAWQCNLSDYTFVKKPRIDRAAPRRSGRPPHIEEAPPTRNMSIPMDLRPIPSPDGRCEALILNYNVAVRKVGETEVAVLSTDGSEGEFYEPETLVWSPDSTKIAAFRVRPGYQRHVDYVISSPEDQVQPKSMSLFYPKPGDVVDVRRPVLFDVAARRQVIVPNDLFSNAYLTNNMFWWSDSRAFAFEYILRGFGVYRFIEVDAASGRPRALISEETDSFFNDYPAETGPKNCGTYFRYDVNDGREIIWMSDRDGWKHLYLYDGQTGKVKNQITKGPWVVRGVVDVDETARRIWFVAGGTHPGEDPYFRHFYRVDFDGSNLTALTESGTDHVVALSPDRRFFVDIASRVDLPSITALRRAEDGTLVTTLEKGDISALIQAGGWRAPESFTAKGRDGKTDIWGVIVRPSNFNPSKKYPVVENIYAGPHGAHVPKSFNWFAPHSGGDSLIGMQSLADLGFIVVQIDGMGTGNRSKAFLDVCYKNLGDAGFPDRILWHKAVAAKYPYYDIRRVGIYGGSAGGQNALGGLLFHPEFYKVAVAFAGCHDNRMDKISWNEQWMSWPIGPQYSQSSNVDNAWRLQGRLLLVTGELDTNVDPSSTLQVANALIKAGKDFDYLVVPNGGHGAGRSSEVQSYGDRKRFEFFVRHLIGQPQLNFNTK